MDIDVMGKHIHGLLAFKDKIEAMIAGAAEAKTDAHDTIDELRAFKADFESALPEIRKAITDTAALVDDVAAIKKQLEPVIAWIVEQQQAAKAAKAAEADKKADAERLLAQCQDDVGSKGSAEVATPLVSESEVPAPAERSETEHTAI